MTERHNKMYREIKGYEDAIYNLNEAVDEIAEARYSLEYGYGKETVLNDIQRVKDLLDTAFNKVADGGYKIK